jgi:hypothetical protein
MEKIHLIGIRTRDLPACSIVPQLTTLPRAPCVDVDYNEIILWTSLVNLVRNLYVTEKM